jgi:hypothetical protein
MYCSFSSVPNIVKEKIRRRRMVSRKESMLYIQKCGIKIGKTASLERKI